MTAEGDRRADGRGHRESHISPALDKQIDLVQHRGQKADSAALRPVQPRHHERTESIRDRGDAARQNAVSPPAIEKRERQRDEHLHRRLGGHRIRERQRQRQSSQRRKCRALSVGQQWIPAPRERVPQGRVSNLPRLSHLMRPRHEQHRHVMRLHVQNAVLSQPRRRRRPRRDEVRDVRSDADIWSRHGLEQKDEHERVEQNCDSFRQGIASAPLARYRKIVEQLQKEFRDTAPAYLLPKVKVKHST